jgi:ketosteroid isomerase-like protein
MKKIFLVFLIIIASSVITVGQTTNSAKNQNSKAEDKLLAANKEYDIALVKGDAAALDRIYSEEFIYTTPDGEVRNKSQQLSFTRSGDLKLESGQSDDVKVRIYKNTAVMTGRFIGNGKLKGKNIEIRERYTAVWVKKRGIWRLVAEQGNFIKQE